jgi:hypothetical protein
LRGVWRQSNPENSIKTIHNHEQKQLFIFPNDNHFIIVKCGLPRFAHNDEKTGFLRLFALAITGLLRQSLHFFLAMTEKVVVANHKVARQSIICNNKKSAI